MVGDMVAELCNGDELGVEEQVRSDDSFRQWISASEVDDRAKRRRGR
jgi:hypothetical protein